MNSEKAHGISSHDPLARISLTTDGEMKYIAVMVESSDESENICPPRRKRQMEEGRI